MYIDYIQEKMPVFDIPNGSQYLDLSPTFPKAPERLCNSKKAVVDFYVAKPTIPFYFKGSFMAHYW